MKRRAKLWPQVCKIDDSYVLCGARNEFFNLCSQVAESFDKKLSR
jgi:hypothetical protein